MESEDRMEILTMQAIAAALSDLRAEAEKG
jgi:hypothetical protein